MRRPPVVIDQLEESIRSAVIGQARAISGILPAIRLYTAGLAPEGRPPGVFLLLGPTGTGKTRTVEAVAEALHGSRRNLLRIDCGEYLHDGDTAKLIGAPPGYLGHGETQALLHPSQLAAVTSARSKCSILLFDEIEKAAPAMMRVLLGILDKAKLRMGDNRTTDFSNTLIFLTSNLGASEIEKAMRPPFGFPATRPSTIETGAALDRITRAAAQKHFSPEFCNRIDAFLTFDPLNAESLRSILDLELAALQSHIADRLGIRAFRLHFSPSAREWLLQRGHSRQYGARELNRTIKRHVTEPLAGMLAGGAICPGAIVNVSTTPQAALRLRAA